MNDSDILDAANKLAAEMYDYCEDASDLHGFAVMGKKVADAYLGIIKRSQQPFKAYLEFANEMIVKDCGLGYDVAVVIAKEMHKRKMVLPELKK